MADRSPAFNPPMNSLPSDKDPMIVKVPGAAGEQVGMDWGFRKSQTPPNGMGADGMTIQHTPQGR